ncbi:MAG: hypothetical protein FWC80_01585 [Firmicutes bacterium]|nr:hypothetical protein [Bacillota bacterium]
MKRISKLLVVIMLACAMGISVFALTACGGNDGNIPIPNPGDGANVNLGNERGAISLERIEELIIGWVDLVEEGGMTDFSAYHRAGRLSTDFAIRGNEAIAGGIFIGYCGEEDCYYCYNDECHYDEDSEMSLYWRNGVAYEREGENRFVIFGEQADLQAMVKDVLSGDLMDIAYDFRYYYEYLFEEFEIVGTEYARGYRITITEIIDCDECCSIYYYDEAMSIVIAFASNGRLLGVTMSASEWEYDDFGASYVTLSIVWNRPTLNFPNDLGGFLRPSADSVIGIEFLETWWSSAVVGDSRWVDTRLDLDLGDDEPWHWTWDSAIFEASNGNVIIESFGDMARLTFVAEGEVTITARSVVNPAVYATLDLTITA